MDADAVRNKPPAGGHPDRFRNALLAAIVFELAVLAGLSVDATGAVADALVVGLFVTFLLGVFGLVTLLYYLLTV